jgi:hypothetical protein
MGLMKKFRSNRGAMSSTILVIVLILLIVVVILQWLSLRDIRKAGAPAATIGEQAAQTAGDLGIAGPNTTETGPGAVGAVKEAAGEAKEVVKSTAEAGKEATGAK